NNEIERLNSKILELDVANGLMKRGIEKFDEKELYYREKILEHGPELNEKEKKIILLEEENVKTNNNFEDIIPSKRINSNCQFIKDLFEKLNGYKYIGIFKSNGNANGRPLFQGPNGGIFYVSENLSRQYISNFFY
ncbi:unnamed protein product, partial [Brachionus calyciflorus]